MTTREYYKISDEPALYKVTGDESNTVYVGYIGRDRKTHYVDSHSEHGYTLLSQQRGNTKSSFIPASRLNFSLKLENETHEEKRFKKTTKYGGMTEDEIRVRYDDPTGLGIIDNADRTVEDYVRAIEQYMSQIDLTKYRAVYIVVPYQTFTEGTDENGDETWVPSGVKHKSYWYYDSRRPEFQPSLLDQIDYSKLGFIQGDKSDAIAVADDVLFDYFTVRMLKNPSGGGLTVPQGVTCHKCPPIFGMRVADFSGRSAKANNCLIDQLRGMAKSKPIPEDIFPRTDKGGVVPANTIRKKIGLEVDIPIPANQVTFDKIAEFFGIHLRLISHVETKTEYFDTESVNSAKTTTEPIILIDSEYGDSVYDLVLHNDHYYAILDFVNPEFDEVTGDALESGKLTVEQRRVRVLSQGRTWLGSNDKKEKIVYKDKIIIFDYETCYNHKSGGLAPYMVGWFEFDPEDPQLQDGDFTKFMGQVHMSPLAVDDPSGDITNRPFINHLVNAPHDVRYTLVSFNGMRFDNFILAKGLLNREKLTDVFACESGLRDVRMGRHATLDLANIITAMSLKGACDGFKTSPKKVDGFNHMLIQKEYENGTLGKWFINNTAKMVEYLEGDVLSTASLFMKLKNALKEIAPYVNIYGSTKTFKTAGSIAWRMIQELVKVPNACKHEKNDARIRKAIVGGRVQVYGGKRQAYMDAKLKMVDFKSLYPTVMAAIQGVRDIFTRKDLTNAMWGAYPDINSTPKFVDTYMPGYVGLYECTIHSQPSPAVIPQRIADKPLNWTPTESFDATITQCDYELIIKGGGSVDVHSGIIWQDTKVGIFEPFISKLAAIKDQQDIYKNAKDAKFNPALRELAKLLMNSASGKCAQRNFDTTSYLAKGNVEQVRVFDKLRSGTQEIVPLSGDTVIIYGIKPEDEIYSEKRAKPSILAVLIYSYSRSLVYATLCQHNIMYSDTDSGLFLEEDYNALMEELPELNPKMHGGARLGDLEEELGEYTTCNAYLVEPKEYAVIPRDATGKITKNAKLKSKGVGLYKDRILVKGTLDNLSFQELAEEYHNSPDGNTVSIMENPELLFQKRVNHENVTVLCSQISRSWKGDDGFSLKQRYLVKKLTGSEPLPGHFNE